jgi:GNAT superfamily N-acetyltransferase
MHAVRVLRRPAIRSGTPRLHRGGPAGADMSELLRPRAILPGAAHPIWIRTAAEDDAEGLADHFGKLSGAARYNRFMGEAGNVGKIARDCLRPSRRPDFFTLVAEWQEEGHDVVIGEASYGFDRATGHGEFAISVCERLQRRGLGSALLSALQSRAVNLGYLDLFGETLKGNEPMKELARKAGFRFTRSSDWRAVRFDKKLAG